MIYILYDTALNGPYTFMLLQKEYPVYQSLFQGTKDETLSDVAPYLFVTDNSLYEKISGPLVSLKALVIIQSDEDIKIVCSHLQKFIYRKTNGRESYFRFWDARVLRRFLPACSPEELIAFFDGIRSFSIIEEDNKTAERFSLYRYNLLESTRVELREIMGQSNKIKTA